MREKRRPPQFDYSSMGWRSLGSRRKTQRGGISMRLDQSSIHSHRPVMEAIEAELLLNDPLGLQDLERTSESQFLDDPEEFEFDLFE